MSVQLRETCSVVETDPSSSLLIKPSEQIVVPEGVHALGARDIKPRLEKWQREHPSELVCMAHIGEPEGDPMDRVVESLRNALYQPDSLDYGDPQGIRALREAFAGHLNRRKIYPYDIDPDWIVVTPGSKMAGMMSARAVLNPEEEDIVAMSELAYPGHYAGVLMNGGRLLVPFRVEPTNGYHHDPDQMREVLHKYQPRLIWVCNPGNPSGLVYTEDEAAPIIDHILSHPSCVLIQDIIYKDLTYDNSHDHMVVFSRIPKIASRVITNDGASKGPRGTGLRIGFVVVPQGQDLLLQNIAGQANAYYAGVSPLTSRGIIPAFEPEGDDDIARFRDSLKEKRDRVTSMMNSIPGLAVNTPQGAFYVLVNVTGTGMNAGEFYNFALGYGVSIVPIGFFGATIPDIDDNPFLREEIADSTVRWSFGGPLEPQIQGLERLHEALSRES